MKLHRIVMKAFGPYADQQVIDFTCLESRSFLLVHGPIGAGKTTILDAVCFAFYGQTSGTERDGRQMRSHYASPETQTEVVVDFALGHECYRVKRSPSQLLPKRRGEGLREVQGEATLWRRTDALGDADGEVVAVRPEAVTKEMGRLLGFKNDQFRQVVVLPQGQFRQLLMAKSDEREGILEALFQTVQYAHIEAALKEAARTLEAEAARAKTTREIILTEAAVDSGDALTARRAEIADAEAEACLATTAAEQRRKEMAASLAAARTAHTLLREAEEAARESQKVEACVPSLHGKQGELERARKSEAVRGAYDESVRATAEATDAHKRHDTARREVDLAASAQQAAETALQGEQAREEERLDAARSCARLQALQPRVKELADAQAALAKATSAVDVAAACERAHASGLVSAEKGLVELHGRLQVDKGQAQLAGERAMRRAKLENDLRAVRELGSLDISLAKAQAASTEAAAAEAAQRGKIGHARTELETLRKAELQGRAARLAQDLHPGQPCAVCGATEHPAPARAKDRIPHDDELDEKTVALSHLEAALEPLTKAREQAQAGASRLMGRREALAAELGEAAATAIPDLEKSVKEARKAEQISATAVLSVDKLEKDIIEATQALQVLRETRLHLAASAQSALVQEGEAKATVATLETDLPSELRTHAAHTAALQKAEAHHKALQQKLAAATLACSQTAQALAGKTATLAAAVTAADTSKREALQRATALAERLAAEGFVDSADFLAAARDTRQQKALAKEIDDFSRARAAASDRLRRATLAAEGHAPPDLASSEAVAGQAERAWADAFKRQTALQTQRSQVEGWLGRLSKLAQDMALVEARYAVAGRLSEVANGQNASKTSFQRFVLAALLDDVLQAASERLDVMTRGRYSLRRVRAVADLRRAGGLDLEVADTYTGQCRPVATLSGGESFLASLALALALADVVQAYAGGICLDTVFIDEGFGSLDPESLDLAMCALHDLRKSGRLVGLISHVPEMRERIDARLEITSGSRGSTARFVLD